MKLRAEYLVTGGLPPCTPLLQTTITATYPIIDKATLFIQEINQSNQLTDQSEKKSIIIYQINQSTKEID